MLFNSLEYLLFLPAVVLIYFLLPQRLRWMLLLGASYFFYASWKLEYLVLIVGSTLIDYWAGIEMGRRETHRQRRPFLILSIFFNVGILFAFKYFNFVSDSVQSVLSALNVFHTVPGFEVLLPVGISFYTFQTLAYSIDVYRGKQEPERHLGIFALYVSFFPQLVAGPIERSTHLLPQFHSRTRFSINNLGHGLNLILWGFFKKLVIADRVALYVNQVYNDPGMHSGWSILLATYLFAFQIFCDFSAYTDIARGSAKILGYDLMNNFRRPYFAASINEFWRRWHISLSSWFRDYLYIPLGGNRVSRPRWYVNLFIVFLVSGLWHGASWTFVIWGAVHGAIMIVEAAAANLRLPAWGSVRMPRIAGRPVFPRFRLSPARHILRIVLTFHIVVFAWIFFRANSVGDAFTLLAGVTDLGSPLTALQVLDTSEMVLAFTSIALMEVVHLLQELGWVTRLSNASRLGRWAARYALFFGILIFGKFGSSEFIYFQF